LYPLQRFKELSPQRYTVIKYNEFVATIEETLDKLYAWMDINLTDTFRQTIKQVVQANHAYESDNVYTLDELGLSRELIEREFREVFEVFQFNRQADIASVMQ
jgi:hypothetical protein